MTDFKVGDRVIVDLDTPESAWHKAEGVVVETRNSPHCAKVQITEGFGADSEARTLYNLTLLPFTYEDIQQGDKIRRTKVYADRSTEVREGVAGFKGSYYWANFGENYILAYDTDHEALEGVTYELLERPEPPAPKLWENRKPGDKITTYKAGGTLDRIFTKRDDGRWDTLVISDVGKLQLGFERSDHELSIFLHGKEAHLVN